MVTKRATCKPKDQELVARREEQILEVATRIFAEDGFDGTDVQRIADEVGVGKGTLYRYFESKERLFLASVDRAMRALSKYVNSAADEQDDPLREIDAAIRAYLAFFDAHPEAVELLIQERAAFKDRKKPTYFEHREANIGRWLALFEGLVAAGRVRKVPVNEFTETISDMLYGTIFINHFAGRKEPMEVQARRILNTVFLGILSDSERAQHRSHADGRSNT
ncbi:MAG: TetR/AcrR family transcriptional regulator [Phycisphaerales bacterium]|nr:TetR/AcrR family transcriptional regulator [Phycisphaerales bacterium]